MIHDFLPVCRADMEKRGWDQCDFVYVCGDAYVDHPSFGSAIISRVLESYGYKVGIIAQPDWKDKESIQVLGRPRLGFLVSAGNMDSMVNHYSVSKRRRDKDSYTPGGVMGKRPDYAAVVYCNLIRSVYKDIPIVIGGIEASLRRLAHYDYWSNKVKHSILVDSQADLISYGMGEKSIVEIADALNSGLDVKDITFIDGTVYKTDSLDSVYDAVTLPSYDEIKTDKRRYAESFNIQYKNTDAFSGKRLVEQYRDNLYVVQNPPATPFSFQEMDDVYALPYMRRWHPSYDAAGGIPAFSEVKFSLISNRGCFGGCSFCALTFHQGRIIQVRSHESIIDEAKYLTKEPDFKGYIHDVGGPTANFRFPACKKQLKYGACPGKQCLFPKPCENLIADHTDYIALLRKLRALPKVKKVFIRSGIRFDYVLADKKKDFLRELCMYHVSGQLKVAPEHVSDQVLRLLGKPENSVYEKFAQEAPNQGIEVVDAEAFTADSNKDFSTQLQKAKESGAELVFLPIYYTEASLILQQANTMGFAPQFFGCDGMDGILSVENFDKSLAEGLMLLTPFSTTEETSKAFTDAYVAAYGIEPNQFAADSYDAIYVIKAAIEKSGVTPDMSVSDICDGMKAAMTEITVDGLTGNGMTWTADGEANKAPKAVVIKDGAYAAM